MNDTKDAFLMAGVRLYSSRTEDLLRGLSAGTVAREAGFHRQTFYRYWATRGEYVRELVRYLLTADRGPTANGALLLPEHRREPADLDAFVEDLANHDFARMMTDPVAAMRIGLLMMRELDHGSTHDLAQEFYDRTMDEVATAFDRLLEHWGRDLAPGCTSRMLARMTQALVVGFVVQAKAATDDPPAEEALAMAIRGLFESLTRERVAVR